jgi:hypothetical protein
MIMLRNYKLNLGSCQVMNMYASLTVLPPSLYIHDMFILYIPAI